MNKAFLLLISVLFATAVSCTTGIEDPPLDDPDEKTPTSSPANMAANSWRILSVYSGLVPALTAKEMR